MKTLILKLLLVSFPLTLAACGVDESDPKNWQTENAVIEESVANAIVSDSSLTILEDSPSQVKNREGSDGPEAQYLHDFCRFTVKKGSYALTRGTDGRLEIQISDASSKFLKNEVQTISDGQARRTAETSPKIQMSEGATTIRIVKTCKTERLAGQ